MCYLDYHFNPANRIVPGYELVQKCYELRANISLFQARSLEAPCFQNIVQCLQFARDGARKELKMVFPSLWVGELKGHTAT